MAFGPTGHDGMPGENPIAWQGLGWPAMRHLEARPVRRWAGQRPSMAAQNASRAMKLSAVSFGQQVRNMKA